MLFYFLDRGKRARKQRSRKRMEHLILRHEAERLMAATVELAAAAAEIKEVGEEADRLFDSLEKHVEEKRTRDFHIRLLKGELEVRKTYPRGVPPYPSPEQLLEQREAEEKQKRKYAVEREMQERLRELSYAIIP
jgi:hypothetical protein